MLQRLRALLDKAQPFCADPPVPGFVWVVWAAGEDDVVVRAHTWAELRGRFPKLKTKEPGDQVLVAYREHDAHTHLALFPRG